MSTLARAALLFNRTQWGPCSAGLDAIR